MKNHWLILILLLMLSACASAPPEQPSIGQIEDKPLVLPPIDNTTVNPDAALMTYRTFLKDAPDGAAYREAMRRSADMQLEYAERTSTQNGQLAHSQTAIKKAIHIYKEYLAKYRKDENNERVLYQLAKAYDLSGQMEDSLSTLKQLISQYPNGQYSEEALFRSGELYFSMRDQAAAEHAFADIIKKYPNSIYYERSLYMAGWSLYLQNRFEDSIQTFFTLLDRKIDGNTLTGDALRNDITPADRELLDDSLKVISLALSYQGIKDPVAFNFDRHGDAPYEVLIYRRLGEFYLSKQRYLDAANTFMNMTHRLPDHALSPQFHEYAIKSYETGGFFDLFFEAKSNFVTSYGVDSDYWKSHDENVRQSIRAFLAIDIKDLAEHFHSIARHTRKTNDFTNAVFWYKEYLKTFTTGPDAAEMNFMLAECLHDAKRYMEAVAEYEKSAYDYKLHKNSAESAYAALLSYKEATPQVPKDRLDQWHRQAIASAIRFSEHFPSDHRVDKVLANTIDELYALHDYAGTVDAAHRLLQRPGQGNVELRKNVLIVLGHAQFEIANYVDAQEAYQAALKLLPANDKQRPKIIKNLAASMYKQGEQKRAAGDISGAIAIFMQIEKSAPAPSIWVTAQYDAAAASIEIEDWNNAQSILEDFQRRKLGNNRLQLGASEKLALVYTKTGQKRKAAHEMEIISASSKDIAKKRDLIWEAATLYRESEADRDAVRLYKQFVKEYPASFSDGIESRHYISAIYMRLNQEKEARFWLKDIIKADEEAGLKRTDRSRQLAGEATLELARPLMQAYQNAKLTLPLKKSLKHKKALMEKTIAMYKKALQYQIADVSTAATYQLGKIYEHFSKAISKSDRPHGLSKVELDQYDILLEDQTYMFQDKAIQLHESNVKHISEGIYDKWVKDSLKELAVLYPVRYDKTEKSEAYFDATH